MKIFVDATNINEIKEALDWRVIDGATTNPALISRENKNFEALIKEI